jgi:hypothetical protein
MGAIQDRLTLSLEETKRFLRLPLSETTHDSSLQLLMASVVQAADLYCNNDFEDDDGVELDIPELVKLGCLVWMDAEFKKRPPGVRSHRAGDVAITYDLSVVPTEVVRHWQPYRLHPMEN